MSNALALAQWLPDTESLTPNPGDAVQVLAVPVNHTPVTQFAPMGGGGGGGGVVMPTTSKPGQFLMSDTTATHSPMWSDADAGRF